MKKSTTRKDFNHTLIKIWNYKWIYLMILPVMAYYIIFKYIPMYGVTIAFKDYNVFEGIFASPWCGFEVFEKILSNKNFWEAIFTYVVCSVWKEIGWGTIIYLAALTGVDESLYEAAYLDGATKFQRLIYITLPSIKSVIVTMLILQISKMMTIGLDAPLLLGNKKVMGVSEVISTYTYRLGIERAKYSDSTAIGLFQSVEPILVEERGEI